MINTGTRPPVVLVVCAVVGLGVLALANLDTIGVVHAFGTVHSDVPVYSSLAAVALALLVWHLWPRSWGLLLVLGAMCAVPTQLLLLNPDSFADSSAVLYASVSSVAGPLLLVGLLGAATVMWQSGRRGASAALVGAVLVVPPLTGIMPVVLSSSGVGALVPVTGFVLIAATVALVIAATVAGPHPVEPVSRPGWRVMIAGAVAGLARVTYHLWTAPSGPVDGADTADYNRMITQHLLVVGLVVLAAGLLLGLLGGVRVLLTGAAAGVLLAGMGQLAGVSVFGVADLPAGVTVAMIVAALVAGMGLALLRARMPIGVAGLGVVIVGLVVWWVVFDRDNMNPYADVARVLTVIMLVVGIIAGVTLFGSLGAVLTPHGETPATLAGVAAAVAYGAAEIIRYVSDTNLGSNSGTIGIFPPLTVTFVCAAGLAILAHRLWAHTPPPTDASVTQPVDLRVSI